MAKRKTSNKKAPAQLKTPGVPLATPEITLPGAPAEEAQASSSTPRYVLALCLLVLLIFFPVLGSQFVSYGDTDCVVENFHVQSAISWQSIQWAFSSAPGADWQPLVRLSHLLDFQFFGLHPWGHHLTSLLLHTANTCLVFLALRRLTGTTWRSWFVAAMFGLHPLHVEPVAWISGRGDLLCAFFSLLAVLAYACSLQLAQGKMIIRSPGAKYYVISLLCFLGALMSDMAAVVLPLVLVLLDFWPLHRFQDGDDLRQALREKMPYVILAIIMAAIAVHNAGSDMAPSASLPLLDRLGNALVSYAGYLGNLICPVRLAVVYPQPDHWSLGIVLPAAILFVGISIFSFALRHRQAALLAGWLWFVITLLPVVGFAHANSTSIADHHCYLSALGLFIILSWGACALTQRWRYQTIATASFATAAIVLCAGLAWRQESCWENTRTLLDHDLAVTKNNVQACSFLADFDLKQGRMDEAIQLCQQAIAVRPDFALANELLGLAYCKIGHAKEGIAGIQYALSLNPSNAVAHADLGDVLAQNGNIQGALAEYDQAIRADPQFLTAYNHMAVLLENSQRSDRAVDLIQSAVSIYPDYADAHVNLGLALADAGRRDNAVAEYRNAIRLNPILPEAHFNLGLLLAGMGKAGEAVGELNAGLRLQPEASDMRNALGAILGQQGRLDEAIQQFQKAVNMDPDDAMAQTNLMLALKMEQNRAAQQANPQKP